MSKAKDFKFWFSRAIEELKDFKENDYSDYSAEFDMAFSYLLDLEKQLQSNEIQIIHTPTLKDVLEVQDFLEGKK